MCPKDADGMVNSVDPDQTAPLMSEPGHLLAIFHMVQGLNLEASNQIVTSFASCSLAIEATWFLGKLSELVL